MRFWKGYHMRRNFIRESASLLGQLPEICLQERAFNLEVRCLIFEHLLSGNVVSKLYFSFDSGWLEREVARKLALGKKLAVSAGWGGVCVCVFPVAQGKWFELAPTLGVFLQDDTPVTQVVPLHHLGQICSFSPIVSVPGETNSGVHTHCLSCFILLKSLIHTVPPNFQQIDEASFGRHQLPALRFPRGGCRLTNWSGHSPYQLGSAILLLFNYDDANGHSAREKRTLFRGC